MALTALASDYNESPTLTNSDDTNGPIQGFHLPTWTNQAIVALTFFRRDKRSDWRFCACAINIKSLMCSEMTMLLWYKYYRLFVRMYINSLESYLSQINTRQTSFEACFDRRVNHVTLMRHKSVTVIKTNVRCYYIEIHFKQLFTVIITGELTNSSWHLYKTCFVVSLDIDDYTFIAHVQ